MKSLVRLLLALCLTVQIHAQTDIVGVYLTWQRDPTTTMTVNWVNLYPDTLAKVWYRTKEDKDWKSATGTHHVAKPSAMQVRRAELSGLAPDTLYEFMLSEPGKTPKGVRRFRTLPAKLTRPLRFVGGGDMMHTRAFVDAMNQRAGALDPDFAVLGGDLAYANGVDATRWVDWFQSWTLHARGKDGRCIPMVVGIGNHEVKGGYNGRIPDDAPYFYGFFPLPEGRAYYALDVADYLSFIVLDSGHTNAIQGPQAEWLAQALGRRAAQRFLFPIYHFPAYGTAKATENNLPCESPRAVELRTHWIPHFERHGVTAVFEHDHHNYKRTHPLRGHRRDDKNGIIYLGDGAWGVNTRTVPKDAWYLAKAEPRRHLFHVTLNPDGTMKAEAVAADGEVFDQVTLSQP
ncbi:MAG: metallophosphoesterase family protein, partial [Prosthecobacter sp.]|nr:metallophosphoesterase family protein [Prosthecobacter sp.]